MRCQINMASHNNVSFDIKNIRQQMPVWIAAAAILQISETMIPHPIPGLRFGFANIVSLVVLIQFGFKPALMLTALRTIVSSFILGSFLSPGFILSFFAGISGICVSGVLLHLFNPASRLRISPIGLAMAGAFIHNLVQVVLAFLLLMRVPQLFYLLPWLSLGSIVVGMISGWLTIEILKALTGGAPLPDIPIEPEQGLKEKIYVDENSVIHRSKPEVKLVLMLIATIIMIIFQNLWLYGFIFGLIMALVFVAGLSVFKTVAVVKRIWAIALGMFLIPVIFNPGTIDFISVMGVSLHQEALTLGLIFALRIILLAILTSVLAQTSRMDELASGIKIVIKPLSFFGFDTELVTAIIFDALEKLPESWTRIRSAMVYAVETNEKSIGGLKKATVMVCVVIFTARQDSVEKADPGRAEKN
jgi:heptaprenyl diphosphate synthase